MIEINSKVAGYFRLKTFLPDGTLTQDTGEFQNLITTQGMDYYGSNITNVHPMGVVSVGSGNTTPAFTDTTLVTFVASQAFAGLGTPIFVAAAGTQPAYWSTTLSYTYGVGAAAGNLAEIGVGWASNTLFSRALIVDNLGVPTTITVLSTEILQVTYEFRTYINVTDQSGSYIISGTTYNTTTRPYNINGNIPANAQGPFFNGVLPLLLGSETNVLVSTTTPLTVVNFDGTATRATYTNGNFYRDMTRVATISNNNYATGIGMLVIISAVGNWQASHAVKIPKDNTKTLTIVYRISWARFTPPP